MMKGKFTAGTAVKLVLLSLMIGIGLSFFGVSPEALWRGVGEMARLSARAGLRFLDWGMSWGMQYILIGAAVVLPVYVVRLLYRRFRKNR